MCTTNDSPAIAAVKAIQGGDVESLKELLLANPDLVNVRFDGKRTLLHVATDWPGHFPNNVATVTLLAAHGADISAPSTGRNCETPLHWSASSDDVAVLDTLLDLGADIEASGAVIGGGTPLADAVAFGQWQAARRLVERGARTTLWQAAGLGLMARVEVYFAQATAPTRDDVTNAFWCACHGGQQAAAEYLFARGADLNWIGHNGLTPLDAATRSGDGQLSQWLRSQGATSSGRLRTSQ